MCMLETVQGAIIQEAIDQGESCLEKVMGCNCPGRIVRRGVGGGGGRGGGGPDTMYIGSSPA